MANPHSPLTKIRARLATWLEPYPDRGEAWCVNCALNGGRTLIVPATGHARHVMQHRDEQGMRSAVSIRVSWGSAGPHLCDEQDDD
jgi:hypothetical protein